MSTRNTLQTTHNSLPEKVRTSSIAFLQEHLACAIDLMLNCKQAHWNIKGSSFIALHELFDGVHEHSREWVDLIAERIMQLGGAAEGTANVVADRTQLPEYPIGVSRQDEHVSLLARSLASFGEFVIEGIEQSDEIGDPITSDLLTQIGRALDKDLWMVESNLPARPVQSADRSEGQAA